MNRDLELVAGFALLASVTAGLLGYPLAALGISALGFVSAVAVGFFKRNKRQAQPK